MKEDTSVAPAVNLPEDKETKIDPEFDDSIFKQEISPEMIKGHVKDLQAKQSQTAGMFIVKPANEFIEEAKKKPIPKKLFDSFWFEGELCFLYAGSNLGKSILAVQIATSISQGIPIPGFKLEANAQKALYFDFELSDKQFEGRYSMNYSLHYKFSDDFIRAEIDSDKLDLKQNSSYEEYVLQSIEQAILLTRAKVVIVDNLTFIKEATERAQDASPLMKQLKALKQKYELSMLVVTHTVKKNHFESIEQRDMIGSSMLMNFCDSAFAIGRSSRDKDERYLKQTKVRSAEHIYGADKVCVCRIEKKVNFLGFRFEGYDTEHVLLRQFTNSDKEDQWAEALELKNQGWSYVKIAKHFNVSDKTIAKWINKIKEINENKISGLLEPVELLASLEPLDQLEPIEFLELLESLGPLEPLEPGFEWFEWFEWSECSGIFEWFEWFDVQK
jgi:archaellum biogenesis ATPase FlaH